MRISLGDTQVLCTASVEKGVPRFLQGQSQGWLTAEYSMLPRATHQRSPRDSAQGKPSGRSVEISRLIGRSLRAAMDLSALPQYSIVIDCDVLQADGGTRTAAITGACVALVDAIIWMQQRNIISGNPLKHLVSAVSVGLYQGEPVLDLEYQEDAAAQTDMNVVMTEAGQYIEIQGTAETQPFDAQQLSALLQLAAQGTQQLCAAQRELLFGEL